MVFIPATKMTVLRESARNGDELAKKILTAQYQGQDFASDLEEFFAREKQTETVTAQDTASHNDAEPVQNAGTGNARLDEWLRSNNIKKGDADYEEAINDYYAEFPNEERPIQEPEPEVEEEIDLTKDMVQGIIDLISTCDKTVLTLMQNEELDDTTKKGAITTLQGVKQKLFDSADDVKKIKQSICKKQENC